MSHNNIARIADALERLARSQARIADAAETANIRRWDRGVAVYVNGSRHPVYGDAALAELDMLQDGAVVTEEFGNEWKADTVGWVCQCSHCLSDGRPFVYDGETRDWLREYGPMHITTDSTNGDAPEWPPGPFGYARLVRGAAEAAAGISDSPALLDGVNEGVVARIAWLDGAQERVARVLSGGLWDSLDDQDRADLLATGRAAAAAALPVRTGGDHE